MPGQSLPRIVQKTAANAGFAFCVSLPIMLTASTLLAPPDKDGRRRTLRDAQAKIEADLFNVWLAGTLYWPAVNMVVFKLVAVQQRAVVNSLFGTAWNVFLSAKANSNLEGNTRLEEDIQGRAAGGEVCEEGEDEEGVASVGSATIGSAGEAGQGPGLRLGGPGLPPEGV